MITATQIPESILAIYHQVGGNRAMVMAFAHWSYSSADTSATFAIAPALRRATNDRITHVRVTLEKGSDTYRVEFLSVSGAWPAGREVSSLSFVYASDLRQLIQSRTGLQLSLGTLGAAA